MNRLNLLYQLDELLKVCQLCDRRSSTNGPEVACKGCETYSHILAIGKQLETKNRERKPVTQKMVLEIETYMKLKGQGKSDADIAKQFGIKQPTLIYYKKKWEKEASQTEKPAAVKQSEPAETETKQPEPVKGKESETELVIQALHDSQKLIQPNTAEEKNTPCNCLSKEEKAEYERLIAALRSDLNEAHNQLDEKDEKIRNLENLHAACEDCENEISSLREANEDLEQELSQARGISQERLETMQLLAEKMDALKDENQAMRMLIKKWA